MIRKFKVNSKGIYVGYYNDICFIADDSLYRHAKNKHKRFLNKYRIYYINKRGKRVFLQGAHTITQANCILEEQGLRIEKIKKVQQQKGKKEIKTNNTEETGTKKALIFMGSLGVLTLILILF